jgi:hypothetical protein
MKSTALNGCWKKVWLEAVITWGFSNQQDAVMIILVLAS